MAQAFTRGPGGTFGPPVRPSGPTPPPPAPSAPGRGFGPPDVHPGGGNFARMTPPAIPSGHGVGGTWGSFQRMPASSVRAVNGGGFFAAFRRVLGF
jgi:hypothetical protein